MLIIVVIVKLKLRLITLSAHAKLVVLTINKVRRT